MRRFEYRDQKSSKFWAIEQQDSEVTISWGRIGTEGHTLRKTYASKAKASAALEALIREKLDKGYVEVEAAAEEGASAKKTGAKKASAKKAGAKKASAKKASAKKASEEDDEDADEDDADDEDETPPKTSAKKTSTKKTGAKKASAKSDAQAAAKQAAAKKAAAKQAAARKAAAAAKAGRGDDADDDETGDDEPDEATTQPAALVEAPVVTVAALQDIPEGGEVVVAGSGSSKYTLRNVGGAYSCTCPAWMHQSLPTERRTCKHLRKYRGDAAEEARVGSALPQRAISKSESANGTTNVPPLLLAHRWEEQDPTGWWLSEKLDGVRAYWDGKQFISRLGNAYLAPDWFIEHLPDFPLDGELFAGRGRFQHAVSIARRMDRGSGWRSLSYVIFDAPGLEHAFEDRIRHLEDHFGAKPAPLAKVLEHRVCKGLADLHEELRRVEDLGGEGVMLRQPGSRYVAGRSDTLLKVKSFLDTEARVIGHQAGTGKHAGRLGALLVELPNGTRFKVGTGLSDAERGDPPEVGAIVTVRYQELTDGGVPRFPSYVGVRDDVDWDALVATLTKS